MLYIHNKGNQFQVERDFFEYIDGNSIPYVILCEDDNTHVLYYLKLNKRLTGSNHVLIHAIRMLYI